MNRGDLLEAARAAVLERGRAYGDPAQFFGRVAGRWSRLLGIAVDARAVALMMAELKLERLVEAGRRGDSHADGWVDLAGYAAIGAEIEGGAAIEDNSGSGKTSCPQREADPARAVEQQRDTTGVTGGERPARIPHVPASDRAPQKTRKRTPVRPAEAQNVPTPAASRDGEGGGGPDDGKLMWTGEQVATLTALAGKAGAPAIGRLVGKTAPAVQARIAKLGLPKGPCGMPSADRRAEEAAAIAAWLATRGGPPTACPPAGQGAMVAREVRPMMVDGKTPLYPDPTDSAETHQRRGRAAQQAALA